MIKIIAELLTFFVFNKKSKKHIKEKIRSFLYGYQLRKKAKQVGKHLLINGKCSINSNTILGDYIYLNELKIEGAGNVKIGNYFHSGRDLFIITQNHDYDNGSALPYGPESIYKDVIIEDYVWIGSKVILLPGTKIGEGAIIQAGAVVHGEIPQYGIAGGNPAKVFKYRDVEHFKKLKSESSALCSYKKDK